MMTDSPTSPQPGLSGKLVVGLLGLCGVVALVGAFLWQNSQSNRLREFWGPAGVEALRTAESGEAFRLEPAAEASGETISVGNRHWRPIERRPIIRSINTPLTFARRTMLYDLTFEWDEPVPSDCPPDYQWALRFQNDSGTWTMLFDLDSQRPLELARCAQMIHVESGRSLPISVSGNDLLRDIFRESFAERDPELTREIFGEGQ